MPNPAVASVVSSTSLNAPAQEPDSTAIRPRNRRLVSITNPASAPSSALSSREASPIPSARVGAGTGRIESRTERTAAGSTRQGGGRGFLEASWSQTWASVQDFASSLLEPGEQAYESGSESANWGGRRDQKHGLSSSQRQTSATGSWGPPTQSRTQRNGKGASSSVLAEVDAALKARKTASVLESHDGVNGGLDVVGSFKKRRSDEGLRESALEQDAGSEHLVYIHHVQPSDTYVGIVVKYKCREDAFRKANGLWSRDNIQIRKWLALPVDACDVKGRPCDGPSYYTQGVDLLAPTPEFSEAGITQGNSSQAPLDDFFSSQGSWTSRRSTGAKEEEDGEQLPWTHVRWVRMDGFAKPVEVARMSRKSLGYFPPRRKPSQHTVSGISTPRESLDVPSFVLTVGENESPVSTTSHRQGIIGGRGSSANQHGTPSTSRSRVSSGGDDIRPVWMRRPGGVGSLSKSVRAPGPEKDFLNTWTKRHFPSLNIESLPSMAIMGSESARFGFSKEEMPATIVDAPPEDGRDLSASGRQAGSGLDKAAATIETWLRGAFTKQPGTPVLGPRGRPIPDEGDLIELAETSSDDGRAAAAGVSSGATLPPTSLLSSSSALGASGRSDGDSVIRGRSRSGTASKTKKAD